jgi:hypothetical protein
MQYKAMQNSKELQSQKPIYDLFGSFTLLVDGNSGNDILAMPNITVTGKNVKARLLNNARESRLEYVEQEKALELERKKFIGRMEGASHMFMAVWLRTNNVDLIHNYGNKVVKKSSPRSTPSEEVLNAYND